MSGKSPYKLFKSFLNMQTLVFALPMTLEAKNSFKPLTRVYFKVC